MRGDFGDFAIGHVKLPGGRVIGRIRNPIDIITAVAQIRSIRQERPAGDPAAAMQVSWLRGNPTVGEVDIDYLKPGDLGHDYAWNSDVRFQRGGHVSHYRRHVRTYGAGLVDWWRRR